MNISAIEIELPKAEKVSVSEDTLSVDLSTGRTILVPLEWFPRLVNATPEERNNWRLIGRGHGIHWEDIDEDLSVEGLLAGRPSGESQESFKKWLNQRQSRLTGQHRGATYSPPLSLVVMPPNQSNEFMEGLPAVCR
jgi:hypothetical protein